MILKEEGNLEEAERFLKKALEFSPSNHEYHFELANVYALRYDEKSKKEKRADALDAAARELEQAIMLNPDFLQAYFNLGVVYKKQGNYEKAREQFRHVLELDPNLVNAYMQIGAIYEEQGFFDEAKDEYLKAKDMDFGNPGIDSAIEDLQNRREEDRDKMLAETRLEQLSRMRYGMGYSENSQAAVYADRRRDEIESTAGFAQTIPHLTTWLISQFMSLREKEE